MLPQLTVGLVEEEVGEEQDVAAHLAQFGHPERELVDAVEEIRTETAPGDRRLEVLVRRRHQADVHRDFARTAHTADAALLQRTQQLHLRLIGEVAHLVEKKRAAVGRLEGPHLVGERPGERPLDMPEELRSGQLTRDGPAIDRHEGLPCPLAAAVDQLRHVLLARTAGAVHQHRHVRRRHQAHIFVELAGHIAPPLDVVERLRTVTGRTAPLLAPGSPFGPHGRFGVLRSGSRLECLADLLEQLVRIDGLGDVVPGPEFHAPHGVLDLGIARHHDHGSRDSLARHPLQERNAVLVGKPHVAQHKRIAPLGKGRAGRRDRTDALHVEAAFGQPGAKHQGKRNIVVYDQNPFHNTTKITFLFGFPRYPRTFPDAALRLGDDPPDFVPGRRQIGRKRLGEGIARPLGPPQYGGDRRGTQHREDRQHLVREGTDRRPVACGKRPFERGAVGRSLLGKGGKDAAGRLGIVARIGGQGVETDALRTGLPGIGSLRPLQRLSPAAADPADRGGQLTIGEGLAQACGEPPGGEVLRAHLPAGRNGHHRKGGVHLADGGKDPEPVEGRHLDVGDHQVEMSFGDEFGRILGIRTALDREPGPAAHRRHHLQLQPVVIDQQHPQLLVRHRLGGLGRHRSRIGFGGLADRNPDDEAAAAPRLAVERDRSSEQLDEPVHDREAQTEAIDPLRRTQSDKLGEDALALLGADAAARIANREGQPAVGHVGPQGDAALIGEFQGIGYQVISDLPDAEGVTRSFACSPGTGLQPQVEPLGVGRSGKARTDRLEKLRGIEDHRIDLHLVHVEPVEIEQAVHQGQQVLRRGAHVLQVERLPLVGGQARKQVDVAHDRAQRRLDVVCDGQHQLLTGSQQRLVVAVGALEGPAVAVAAVDVAPQHRHEQQHEDDGPGRHPAEHPRRAAADRLVFVDAAHEVVGLLLLEVHDQAVDLRVDQVVAVTQAQPLAPRLVVDVEAFAGDTVLQGPQHDGDRIAQRIGPHLGGRSGNRIDDDLAARDHHCGLLPGRAEQVGQAAEEPPFGPRHGDRIGLDNAPQARQGVDLHRAGQDQRVGQQQRRGVAVHPLADRDSLGMQHRVGQRRQLERVGQRRQRVGKGRQRIGRRQGIGRRYGPRQAVGRRLDQRPDVLFEQVGRGAAADRTEEARRPALLVGQQPHDAVQTHRLQRIAASGQRAQRIDPAAHGAQLLAVAFLVGLVAGDHQLAATLGLVEVVEHLIDGAAFGVQLRIGAVGSRKTDHLPVDIAHREDADGNQNDVAGNDLRLDEFRLFHAPKIVKVRQKPHSRSGMRTGAAAAGESRRRLPRQSARQKSRMKRNGTGPAVGMPGGNERVFLSKNDKFSLKFPALFFIFADGFTRKQTIRHPWKFLRLNTSRSNTPDTRRSTTSRSPFPADRSTDCSAPTAPARPPSSGSSTASPHPTAGASASTATKSPPTTSTASATCPRSGDSTRR
uniref:Uncharacterized protein n=1 Tax=Siphoviridae sp. ctBLh2 TaxID=2827803 RepID=A0A8S5S3H5_9CAUD|nr:MAG TPA: hypothetical protein [Siphoviridae sp. ctBLh2]